MEIFAKVFFALFFIVALILSVAWFARRSGLVSFVNNKNFRVLANLPLGNKEKLALVQVGPHIFLLGISGGNISCLHKYEEGENPLECLNTDFQIEKIKKGGDFASQIKKILSQGLQK